MQRVSLTLLLACSACEPETNAPPPPPHGAKPRANADPARVQVPKSDDYTLRQPRLSWGAPCAVEALTAALRDFRGQSGFEGRVVVSDMSQRAGPLPPHRTHDRGRDVDIRLPTARDYAKWKGRPPLLEEVDWVATWGLVLALSRTEGVERVILHHQMQKYLYDAVLDAGVDPEPVDRLLQYPRSKLEPAGFLRHGEGMSHLHVHFECSDTEGHA